MSSLLLILLSAVLVCYYAPMIPALHPFIEADHFESIKGIACASAITLLIVPPIGYLTEHLLLAPYGLQHLRTLLLVIVIMAVAQLAGIAMQFSARWVLLSRKLVLLTASNCAVLGVALLNTIRARNFGEAMLLGAGTGVAFAAMLLMFTALQQRLRYANVPLVFRDAPVALVTVGLMALGCMGLTGLIRE